MFKGMQKFASTKVMLKPKNSVKSPDKRLKRAKSEKFSVTIQRKVEVLYSSKDPAII